MNSITALNQYRLLGCSGLRVSPLCLGAMTFGTEWGWGADARESRKVFDAYASRGGNFIDTANAYTAGTSEKMVGEFIKSDREHFVVATKFTLSMRPDDPNASGNQRKNMMQSVEASLKRLKTDFIDLLWVHAWDGLTPVDELMRGLDDLVRAGKVFYVGVSDFPAWKVSQANTLAALRGWSPFVALQIEYSLVERTVERELIPMALECDLAVTPWSPLAGGILTGKYSRKDAAPPKKAKRAGMGSRLDFARDRLTESTFTVIDEVQQIAKDTARSASQVALNWLLQKPGVLSPIIGARTLVQLEDNMGCLDFTLTEQQMRSLDAVSAVDLGFPTAFLERPMIHAIVHGASKVTKMRWSR